MLTLSYSVSNSVTQSVTLITSRASIGVITHQGHISKVNANAHSVTQSVTLITSRASCDAKNEERIFPKYKNLSFRSLNKNHARRGMDHSGWSLLPNLNFNLNNSLFFIVKFNLLIQFSWDLSNKIWILPVSPHEPRAQSALQAPHPDPCSQGGRCRCPSRGKLYSLRRADKWEVTFTDWGQMRVVTFTKEGRDEVGYILRGR